MCEYIRISEWGCQENNVKYSAWTRKRRWCSSATAIWTVKLCPDLLYLSWATLNSGFLWDCVWLSMLSTLHQPSDLHRSYRTTHPTPKKTERHKTPTLQPFAPTVCVSRNAGQIQGRGRWKLRQALAHWPEYFNLPNTGPSSTSTPTLRSLLQNLCVWMAFLRRLKPTISQSPLNSHHCPRWWRDNPTVTHRIQVCTSFMSESAKEHSPIDICCMLSYTNLISFRYRRMFWPESFHLLLCRRSYQLNFHSHVNLRTISRTCNRLSVYMTISHLETYIPLVKSCSMSVANHKYKEKMWDFRKADTRKLTPCYHNNCAVMIPLACSAIYRSASILESYPRIWICHNTR